MNKTQIIGGLAVPTCLAFASLALAGGHSGGVTGDAKAGEQKIGACTDCHAASDFAGQTAAEIGAAIKNVAAGNVTGHPDVGEVSDQDIADLAAFLASAN